MKVAKKQELTKEFILTKVLDYDIYNWFVPNLKINTAILSPFRNESHPSFLVKLGNDGFLHHKDYVTGQEGRFTDLVMQLYGCSYNDALRLIAKTFGLLEEGEKWKKITSTYTKPILEPKRYSFIQVNAKKFTKADNEYWNQYKLDRGDLNTKDVEVYSVKDLWLNRKKINLPKDEICFAYLFFGEHFKIYRPYAKDKKDKWLSNVPLTQMYNLDAVKGAKTALVEKSYKDLLVCSKFITTSVCAVQNESTVAITPENITFLQENCDNVVLCWDNDETGVKNCTHYNQFGFGYWNIPKKYKAAKDKSDFILKFNEVLLKQEIEKKIKL